MVARILGFLGLGIILMLIIFWVITGGPSKSVTAAQHQPNSIQGFLNGSLASKILSFKLPWSGGVSRPQGTDISQYIGNNTGDMNGTGYTQEQLDQAKNFGMPSPYRSQVTLQADHATENDPAKEYLSIAAAKDNANNIDLMGWSVQSIVSGARLYLPDAAEIFIGGAVNETVPVSLPPGGTAIITSGVSPVGVSFRENMCTGYLGKLQSFYPGFGFDSCPDPSDALPETAYDLRAYGSSCLDYVRGLSRCEFPRNPPLTISSACRAFVADTFSYNGCVRTYREQQTFLHHAWRLYLNSPYNIWDNAHDIIRLLDAKGRTVDAVTY